MRVIVTVVLMVPFGALAQTSQGYAGSTACKTCHPAVYNRWSKTLMANVVRDPKAHPDAIIPDLSKPDPLVKFTKDDIAFVYGSKWKQRYFTKKGDDYLSTRRTVGREPSDLAGISGCARLPIGGQPFTLTTICSGPRARSVTAAIR